MPNAPIDLLHNSSGISQSLFVCHSLAIGFRPSAMRVTALRAGLGPAEIAASQQAFVGGRD